MQVSIFVQVLLVDCVLDRIFDQLSIDSWFAVVGKRLSSLLLGFTPSYLLLKPSSLVSYLLQC